MSATFTVFGGAGVARDGRAVPVRGRRERAVLAVLLAADGAPVPADRLLAEAWEGAAPPSAAASLHVAVSRLRSAIEPGRDRGDAPSALVTIGDGYALRRVPGDSDAGQYARLVDGALSALTAGDAVEALALCDRAAALWTGEPYAGAPDTAAIRAEHARLEDLRLSAVEVRAEALLELEREPIVAAELEPLLEAYPFRERLWQLAARALYRSGRQADALATLRRARTVLADELGIDPSPDLQRLELQILDQDPDLAGPTHAPPAPRPPAPEPDIVGRDTELARLRGLLHEAMAGSARFALVEGEPGIGKTRLLEAIAAQAESMGARTAWGRCVDTQVVPAYWPWLEIIGGLVDAGLGDALPEEAVSLLGPSGVHGSGLTQDRRFRVFESIVAALTVAAADKPLVVLIEDLHWADPASAELVSHLAMRLRAVRILVVLSLRELELGRADAVTAAVSALVRRPDTRRIDLTGVPAAASPALVAAAVGRPVDARVAAAVHRRAEGNPFLMGELSRLLATESALDDVSSVDHAGVPASVRDVVRDRLATLPADTRALLEVAAVVGREADLTVLVAASGRSEADCLAALEEALVARVLTDVPDVPGRLRFTHALVAEAALADAPSIRVARLHARVADALLGSGDEEAIAGHLWAAGPIVPPARAADALEAAAALAARRTAFESADLSLARAAELRRAATAAGIPDGAETELRTVLAYASLHRELAGYGAAFDAIDSDRAYRLLDTVQRPDLRMALLHLHWGAAATSGRVTEATRIAEELRDLGERSDDPILQMLGHHAWAVQSWHLGRLAEAADHARTVDRMIRSAGPAELDRIESFDNAALFGAFAVHILDLAGRIDDAAPAFAELARRFPETYEVIVVANFVGFSAVCAGRPEAVLDWYAQFAPQRDTGFGLFAVTDDFYRGWAVAVREDAEAGLSVLEDALVRFLAMGFRTALAGLVCAQVEALLVAGRPLEQVRSALETGAAIAESSGEPLALPYLDVARARLAAAGGAPSDEVDRHLEAARLGAIRSGNARLHALVTRLADELAELRTTAVAGERPTR